MADQRRCIPEDEPSDGAWRHGFAEGAQGVLLHYAELPAARGGDAPLVLLLHGFPEFWWSWRHQMQALSAAGYRVVAPDLRGYNLSDKPKEASDYAMPLLIEDVARLIAHFGRERAVVAGHDWGGAIAWHFAIERPELTDRLMVLNAPHPEPFQRALGGKRPNLRQLRRSWYMYMFQLPRLPERWLAVNDYERIGLILRNTAAHPEAFPPDVLQHYRTAASRPGALRGGLNYYRAAAGAAMQAARQDSATLDKVLNAFGFKPAKGGNVAARTSWDEISAPTLLIWGEKDRALGKELTTDMDDLFSGPFELVYLPDCAHWVQQECPQEVNRIMLGFLERYPPTSGAVGT